MKRVQIYVEDDLWKLLQILARQSRSTISDLVRKAVREKYCASPSERARIFHSVIGLWKDRRDLPPTARYLRGLRKGRRLKELLR